jgi:hypothetical protein
MLPKEAIQDYKRLYKKRFGKELDDAEASRRANNLVAFYRAVLKPNDQVRVAKQQKPKP